jgi:hypothetical protein
MNVCSVEHIMASGTERRGEELTNPVHSGKNWNRYIPKFFAAVIHSPSGGRTGPDGVDDDALEADDTGVEDPTEVEEKVPVLVGKVIVGVCDVGEDETVLVPVLVEGTGVDDSDEAEVTVPVLAEVTTVGNVRMVPV